MAHGFDRVSLAIALDEEYFPFDQRYLWGPAPFGIPALRVYVHEVLHFWQALSSGFIANLALGEWLALEDFEQDGDPSHNVELMADFTGPARGAGFSTWELHEALCRFWDLHITGPAELLADRKQPGDAVATVPLGEEELFDRARSVRPYTDKEFDELMQLEDAYAEPYRLMLERVGSRRAVVLFPLVGFCAMQSKRPAEVFADVVPRLSETLTFGTGPRASIHELWPAALPAVWTACQQSSARVADVGLTPGWQVAQAIAARGHPIYTHYLQLLGLALSHWGDLRPNFALPGDPECRQRLMSFFLPPVTQLRRGRWACDATMVKVASLQGPVAGLLRAEELADASEDLNRRARSMRVAALRARLRGRPGSPNGD